MPLGAAVSLPLSGSVGVHHTGRVHPRANGQRLLLHAGRGPAGQVVLDPEHLRGPDAPTAAAAAVQPRGQNNTSKKQEEEEKSAAKKKSPAEKEQVYRTQEVDAFFTDIETPRSLKAAGEDETGRRREGRKDERRTGGGEFIQLHNFLSAF